MSGFKKILVPLSDAETGETPLTAAFTVGRDFASHVTALHVRNDPANAIPLVGEGMSGAMVDEMMDMAERQAAERAARTRKMFEHLRESLGVPLAETPPAPDHLSVAWSEETGREEDLVARRGRLCDLLVMARALPDRDLPSLLTINAALMESGRPLLLTPPELGNGIGRRIAIAWNGSVEASRSVHFALPFLHRADEIVILSERSDAGEETQGPGEMARYLAWHGLQAKAHAFTARESSTGATLLAEAKAMDADLLVMGAYTHSRLRQLILGGVTRHVLHNATIPVLLSH
ncbi:universal stress protein [Telmatospirillum sp. J64-1]|uniref:universal stress protein n=1 Tax=Telmatospirillum sp. J64-1 TaxID=2502183 RepID=UPI00115F4EFD|nr:universal stress protein [Telmatospirillum sp. J64-1]